MKQSEAKEFLPIIKAWSEGKTLEFNSGTGIKPRWQTVADVEFSEPPSFYRIKPEPREFWVLTCDVGFILNAGTFTNFDDADKYRKVCYPHAAIIKCKEVVE